MWFWGGGLVFPATPTLQHDFTILLGSSTISPSSSVRNLGVIFDDELTFKEHIAKTARSCRFALHNIRKIRQRSVWQSMLHNFLSRHLPFLGWTTAMLFWLDFHQTQSNLYKWFRMQRHDWSSTSPKEPMLHLKFKTLMLAYRTTTVSAPAHFHSQLRIYIPSRSLKSASKRCLVVPSQRGSKSLSRTFSFTIPGW